MKKTELNLVVLKKTAKHFGLFVFFMFVYGFCFSQTIYTWKSPSVDKEWSNKKNWSSNPSGGTFPGDNGSSSDSVVISSGSIVVSNGSYSIAKLALYPSSNASLTISSGATLNIVGGSAATVGFQMSPSSTAIDTLIVNGTLAFTGTFLQALSIGGKSGSTQYFENTGTLNINAACSGPAFVFNSSGVNYVFSNSGSINIANSGINQAAMLSNNGNLLFNNTGNISLSGSGRVAFGGITGVFNNSGSFTTDMDLNCSGKFNNKTGGVLTFTGLSIASTYNAMQATVVFNNQGGTLNSAPRSKNAIGISGINTFTAGTISPGGSSIGVMTISAVAPVTSPMSLKDTIRIQVNGDKTVGIDYDRLSGTGGLSFDISGATLDITGIFTPSKTKDTITIIIPGGGATQGNIAGTFASVIGLASGWSVYYTPSGVKLVYNAALPVKLVSFSAITKNGINVLEWKTATEINNKGFCVQRQKIYGGWENLGFVVAMGRASKYSFEDNAPFTTSYYRLKQVDSDGNEDFSHVVSVNNSKDYKLIITPNPTTDKVQITLPSNNTAGGNVEIMVYDFSGKQLVSKKAARTTENIDLSNMAKGTYMLKVISNKVIYSEKVVRK